MRNDAGLDGDAQRLSQLVWMLFLKILDDQEKRFELHSPERKSILPENIRWRNWAENPEGITGNELIAFVDEKLFPTLRSLQPVDETSALIRGVFSGLFNYMKSGTIMRMVVNELNKINFNKGSDKDELGFLYEGLLREMGGALNKGEFYTPRPVTNFVVNVLDPKQNEKILDPACGTAGFLISALEYIKKNTKSVSDIKKAEKNIQGWETKSLPYLLATTNFILHDVDIPNQIVNKDTLKTSYLQYEKKDRVDVIIANPPFGGTMSDGDENNFPQEFRTKETAVLFTYLFFHLLKSDGRAGVVLPDGFLFGDDNASVSIRKKLLEECNLHTIVRLPRGVFTAGVMTNLLFFEKGQKTENVWYYQLPLPKDLLNGYTKTKPITDGEFDVVRAWWSNRVENEYAWKVSMEDIKAKNWNLDFKNPHQKEVEQELSSKELVERILKGEEGIKNLIKEIL